MTEARPDPAHPFRISSPLVSRDLKKWRAYYFSQSRSRSRSREKRKTNWTAVSAVYSSRARLWLLPFFAFCFSFIFFLFSFFSLSRKEKAEGGRTSGRDDHADVRCVVRAAASSRPSTPLPPRSPLDGRGWPVIGRGRSHGRPAIAGLGRNDVFALARVPPSILPFSFISLLPSLPYPLLFHALFFVFEILLDSSVSFSSEKIFHDYSFFFFPLVRTTLDLFIRKIYIYM